jgi:hypothetical protein
MRRSGNDIEGNHLRGAARGPAARAAPPKRAASWITFMARVELSAVVREYQRVYLMGWEEMARDQRTQVKCWWRPIVSGINECRKLVQKRRKINTEQ